MGKTKVLVITNHKGGCGKTSLVGNLGYELSSLGKKVLLIDTDSQRNLSNSFIVNDETTGKSFYDSIVAANDPVRTDLRSHVVKTEYENLDMVIADINLSNTEAALTLMNFPEQRIRTMLEGIIQDNYYDFVIFDTDKGLGKLSISILNAADYVIVPILPSAYGIDGIGSFINHYQMMKRINTKLEILGVALSIVDSRENVGKEVREILHEVFGEKMLFNTTIVKDVNVNKAQEIRKPVSGAFKKSNVIECYRNLAKEVISRVK